MIFSSGWKNNCTVKYWKPRNISHQSLLLCTEYTAQWADWTRVVSYSPSWNSYRTCECNKSAKALAEELGLAGLIHYHPCYCEYKDITIQTSSQGTINS